jgi:hypothetical protein
MESVNKTDTRERAGLLASDFLDLPLTILAYQVVAQITRRQEARVVQLANSRTA